VWACVYSNLSFFLFEDKLNASAAVRAAANRVAQAKARALKQAQEVDNDTYDENEVVVVGDNYESGDGASGDYSALPVNHTKARLLRQLAIAERKKEKDEADRVRKLVKTKLKNIICID
jgi:beta-glucosidase-like glycosyl hydrolase